MVDREESQFTVIAFEVSVVPQSPSELLRKHKLTTKENDTCWNIYFIAFRSASNEALNAS
jgi:hypothetical protein